MDYSPPIDSSFGSSSDDSDAPEGSHVSWRSFIDECPFVVPTIANHHQPDSLIRTSYYNLTNSCEPIRMIDYFSRSSSEIQRSVVLNQLPNLTPIGQFPTGQVIKQPVYFTEPLVIDSRYSSNLVDSRENVFRSVDTYKVSASVNVPPFVNNGPIVQVYTPPPDLLKSCQSVTGSGSYRVSAFVSSVNNPIANLPAPEDRANDSIAYKCEFPALESDAMMNKENNDLLDLNTESEIYQQHCKYFKKKRALVGDKLQGLVKLTGVLKLEKDKIDAEDDSIKFVSKAQNEKAQRLPLKEQFSYSN